jgi:ergothioneine biosynthesis protein EgtB
MDAPRFRGPDVRRAASLPPAESPADRYLRIRAATLALAAPLDPEDCVAQSMPDASPVKWHLAHTTWFFERFVLRALAPDTPAFDPAFDFLFNSYYEAVGARHARPERGLLTRPSLARVREYRASVDARMADLLDAGRAGDAELAARVDLGLAHEEQHQELVVTDLKHLLSCHPLRPSYHERRPGASAAAPALAWLDRPGGFVRLGAAAEGFALDHERPRHRAWLEPHAIAARPVTNGEYAEFVRDGGYRDPALWLSDGWTTVQREGWSRPLYWQEDLAAEFTLAGMSALDPHRPAVHLSYYEADAYARWAGARLPTEAEWEALAGERPAVGHFADSGEPAQLYGDVWEWTSSPYVAYPGYRPATGALGEYNGKFMCNQFVLRGGSCASPPGHLRASYRNFFPPAARWQFAGLRLARDAR